MLSAAAPVFAQGGAGTQPRVDPLAQGAKYFDDAIRYVAQGRQGIPQVRDFYAKLDADLKLDNAQHQGQMRVWFQQPNNYRQELTTNNATTTKILNGGAGWIRTPNGVVRNLMKSAEGRRTMTQLKDDRQRLKDLTQFLTLQTLKGPGVKFRFDGVREGTGTYAGQWLKVVRLAPGKTNITFWLAYAGDPRTGQATATYPGIVRVDGDAAGRFPTEDYILKNWSGTDANRAFRYPRQIEAYSLLKNRQGQTVPARFLWAKVAVFKMNAGIDPSRFQQPAPAGRQQPPRRREPSLHRSVEPPLELPPRHRQSRGAAMRTRVAVVQRLGLLEQGQYFVGVEHVPRHDRRAAGHPVDRVAEQRRAVEPVRRPLGQRVEDVA